VDFAPADQYPAAATEMYYHSRQDWAENRVLCQTGQAHSISIFDKGKVALPGIIILRTLIFPLTLYTAAVEAAAASVVGDAQAFLSPGGVEESRVLLARIPGGVYDQLAEPLP